MNDRVVGDFRRNPEIVEADDVQNNGDARESRVRPVIIYCIQFVSIWEHA